MKELNKIDHVDQLLELHQNHCLEGFYEVPDEVYFHKDCPGLSRSELSIFCKSPREYYLYTLRPNEETEATRFGTMFHLAMENFDRFKNEYAIAPEFKGLRGGALKGSKLIDAVKAWELENGKKAVLETEFNAIVNQTKFLKSNKRYQALFHKPAREITCFARCTQSGVLMRAKFDLIEEVDDGLMLIGDYKTIINNILYSESKIGSKIKSDQHGMGLYFQNSFYRYIVSCLGYKTAMKFIFVEKEPPYGVRIVDLCEDYYRYGLDQILENIEKYKICSEKNSWPSYDTEVTIELPHYLKGY